MRKSYTNLSVRAVPSVRPSRLQVITRDHVLEVVIPLERTSAFDPRYAVEHRFEDTSHVTFKVETWLDRFRVKSAAPLPALQHETAKA